MTIRTGYKRATIHRAASVCVRPSPISVGANVTPRVTLSWCAHVEHNATKNHVDRYASFNNSANSLVELTVARDSTPTFAPDRASAIAIPLPIPRPPPVTSAILPLRSMPGPALLCRCLASFFPDLFFNLFRQFSIKSSLDGNSLLEDEFANTPAGIATCLKRIALISQSTLDTPLCPIP